MKSDRTLLGWYKRINKRFFDGNCPERVCVRWADPEEEERGDAWEEKYFGEAERLPTDPNDKNYDRWHDFAIVLSRRKNDSWIVKISTLVHEMIHLATDLKDDHGPAFEQWRQYVADRGIFKKHALRKDRTLF
jgi:hypothetical protein